MCWVGRIYGPAARTEECKILRPLRSRKRPGRPISPSQLGATTPSGSRLHAMPGGFGGHSSGPVIVPSPSCPDVLSPQHKAGPPVVTPQVWFPPMLTLLKRNPPATAVGTIRSPVVPLPSAPAKLYPQQ